MNVFSVITFLTANTAVAGLLLLIVLYLLAKFAGSEDKARKFYYEMWQVVATFIHVSVILFVFALIPSLMLLVDGEGYNEICLGHDYADCHIKVAGVFLERLMYEYFEFYKSTYYVNLYSRLIGDLMFGATFAQHFHISGIMPFKFLTAGLSTVIGNLNIYLNSLGVILMAQIYVLWIFSDPAVVLMLISIALIFRMVWFTRKLGGLLLAIFLGTYFFLPFVYAGLDAIYRTLPADDKGYRIGTFMDFNFRHYEIGWQSIFDYLSVLFSVFLIVVKNSWLTVQAFFAPGGFLEEVFYYASEYYWYIVFLPFLAFVATIGFIKTVSPMLGGDVEIAGLTHLI